LALGFTMKTLLATLWVKIVVKMRVPKAVF